MTETGSWQITTTADAGSAAPRLVVIATGVTRGWCLGFLTDLTASELKQVECAPGLAWRA